MRNFRQNYYLSLGVQWVQAKPSVENALQGEVLDIERLNKLCLWVRVPHVYRPTVWKLLLGALPLPRRSWSTIDELNAETFTDICNFALAILVSDGATLGGRVSPAVASQMYGINYIPAVTAFATYSTGNGPNSLNRPTPRQDTIKMDDTLIVGNNQQSNVSTTIPPPSLAFQTVRTSTTLTPSQQIPALQTGAVYNGSAISAAVAAVASQGDRLKKSGDVDYYYNENVSEGDISDDEEENHSVSGDTIKDTYNYGALSQDRSSEFKSLTPEWLVILSLALLADGALCPSVITMKSAPPRALDNVASTTSQTNIFGAKPGSTIYPQASRSSLLSQPSVLSLKEYTPSSNSSENQHSSGVSRLFAKQPSMESNQFAPVPLSEDTSSNSNQSDVAQGIRIPVSSNRRAHVVTASKSSRSNTSQDGLNSITYGSGGAKIRGSRRGSLKAESVQSGDAVGSFEHLGYDKDASQPLYPYDLLTLVNRYAQFDPVFGKHDSMPDHLISLASAFLLICIDQKESDPLFLFAYTVAKYRIPFRNEDIRNFGEEQIISMQQLLHTHDAFLHDHIESKIFQNDKSKWLSTFQCWFLSLFSSCVPTNMLESIWDIYFGGAQAMLSYVGLSILLSASREIMSITKIDEFEKFVRCDYTRFGDLDVIGNTAISLWERPVLENMPKNLRRLLSVY